MSADIDQLALVAAREVINLPAARSFKGGWPQKQARISCIVAEAIQKAVEDTDRRNEVTRQELKAVEEQLAETRADERQIMRYLEDIRMVLSPDRDFPTMISEARKTVKTAELAVRFAKAKGRFHSQQTMCDLMEHLGLPCVRPTSGK
ncbi:hypothetical protein [Vreelandella sulfidaeris]|uniref:Uncharacterized protein n=1 Tax=Vreelandella sulfidaeris TaxID=115553 RepID=A0A455U6D4_9GAMM|nr:hypothetical protein HSBAA_30260 [Halomonas sulfidaeris]